jgi:hypothetical protein
MRPLSFRRTLQRLTDVAELLASSKVAAETVLPLHVDEGSRACEPDSFSIRQFRCKRGVIEERHESVARYRGIDRRRRDGGRAACPQASVTWHRRYAYACGYNELNLDGSVAKRDLRGTAPTRLNERRQDASRRLGRSAESGIAPPLRRTPGARDARCQGLN